MNPKVEQVIRARAGRVLRARAHALRAEVYGVLEEAKVGRGRTYSVTVRGIRRTHTASAPGDPPARLTGRLMESVRVTLLDLDNLVAHVGPDPSRFRGTGYYPAFLEFGTRTIAPRPFMRTAADRFKRAISEGGRPSDAP